VYKRNLRRECWSHRYGCWYVRAAGAPFDPEDFVPEGYDDLPDAELAAAGWDALLDFEELLEDGRPEELDADRTPEVAEFAPAELGAVLGVTDQAAKGLIADALDLRHRFPLLWRTVHEGAVEVWLARNTAEQARVLSKGAAATVDRRIAGIAGTLTWPRGS
jgi:hypothetical protein